MKLADKNACTGCGACAYVCPKECITFITDKTYGIAYPVIDDKTCISCGKCRNACPALSPINRNEPLHAYAAWSLDEEERRTSASGGIAAEIYKFAINKGWSIVGAAFGKNLEVSLELSDNPDSIKKFKNSKYVFSSAAHIYQEINTKLKSGKKVAVIALPCQIAAIRKIFKRDIDNLLLVDLVCHGTTPYLFLFQHIKWVEQKYGEKVMSILFRDPMFLTETFTLTFSNASNHRFYTYNTKKYGDTYQISYHGMISYRENCYHCPFAESKRVSDITLSDYKGLGALTPPYRIRNSRKVSSILINTEKGNLFVDALIEEGKIVAQKRPVEEPIRGDSQLRNPSMKSIYRKLFEVGIKVFSGNFERTMRPIVYLIFLERKLKKMAHFIKRAFF